MKRPILIALALAATLAFAALGIWQIERRTWKLDLIARVEARSHAAPVDAFQVMVTCAGDVARALTPAGAGGGCVPEPG